MWRLESCYFGDGAEWSRMANVLRWSASQHCPRWRVSVESIVPSAVSSPTHVQSYERNTQKLRWWAARVAAADDGECLLLVDTDTVILRDLDDLWSRPFDVAYTVRRRVFPFNGGVVALRVSSGTRAFMAAWRAENERLLLAREEQRQLQRRFGGLNQQALGLLLARDHGLEVRPLPCAEWNCEDTAWADYDPAVTRILHVKGALRRGLFRKDPMTEDVSRVARVWQTCEQQLRAGTVSV